MTKIVVIDDTKHVREMLVSMLELDGFEVVGQGSNGEEAVEIAVRERPDVVILDYSMPVMDGLSAARQVREAVPGQKIILYTAYLDETLQAAAADAGVAVCVGKVEGLESLERNISELCLQMRLK